MDTTRFQIVEATTPGAMSRVVAMHAGYYARELWMGVFAHHAPAFPFIRFHATPAVRPPVRLEIFPNQPNLRYVGKYCMTVCKVGIKQTYDNAVIQVKK
jgi:hypothetical protein